MIWHAHKINIHFVHIQYWLGMILLISFYESLLLKCMIYQEKDLMD